MISISCEEMKAMDSYAINNIGIPSIVLMENAALKVIKNIDLNNIDRFFYYCLWSRKQWWRRINHSKTSNTKWKNSGFVHNWQLGKRDQRF